MLLIIVFSSCSEYSCIYTTGVQSHKQGTVKQIKKLIALFVGMCLYM